MRGGWPARHRRHGALPERLERVLADALLMGPDEARRQVAYWAGEGAT